MSSREEKVTYRQTYIESNYGGGCSCPPGGIFTPDAVQRFTSQHANEKDDMRNLNEKLSDYVRGFKSLEDENRRLQALLDDLKRKWGFDSAQVKDQYDQELVSLRKQIDDISQEKAVNELHAKRAECDIMSTRNLIDVAQQLISMNNERLNRLRQQVDATGAELEAIGRRYTDKQQELQRSRDDFDRLQNDLKESKDRFDREAIERVTVQNQLQTIEEQIAFMKAVHEEERNELMSLGSLSADNNQFYRTELTRVINLIKRDFETLTRERQQEFDGYYQFKTEEFHKYVEEQKRKRAQTEGTSSDDAADSFSSSSKTEFGRERQENEQLQKENASLFAQLQQLQARLEDALNRAQRNQEDRDREQMELCGRAQQLEREISGIIDNNVSLQFEINTYRRLLDLEENRPPPRPVTPPPAVQQPTVDIRTMTVTKSAQGSVSIDQVDPEGNFIVLENVGGSNREQDLTGWSIRRKIDAHDDIVYRFPNNTKIAAGTRIRILSAQSARNTYSDSKILVAQDIQTWGIGNTNETRLMDADNQPKALYKQSFS